MHILAIDQGGSATRAVVLDERGGRRSAASIPIATTRPAPGRVEQDAETLARSVREAADLAISRAGLAPRDIAAAGLAVQRANVVCWDRSTGRALSPALSWQDHRGEDLLPDDPALVERAFGITGLPHSAHFGATKLAWCRAHLDDLARAERDGDAALGPLASFLVARATRERAWRSECVTAGRTALWDRSALDWSDELCARFGIPREALPPTEATIGDHGELAVDGGAIPLRAVTGDQNAAVFAGGPTDPEVAYVNVGTGAFVLRSLPADPGPVTGLLSCPSIVSDALRAFVVEGTVHGAGSAMSWLAASIAEGGDPADRRDALYAALPTALRDGPDPPVFLNAVSGLGSPYWRDDVTSRFLSEPRDGVDAAAAVVESVAFLIAENVAEIDRAVGPCREIRASGGLSRLDGLCSRIASLCGVPVSRTDDPEATARGVAWLAREGPEERFPRAAPELARHDPARDDALAARRERWREAMREVCR